MLMHTLKNSTVAYKTLIKSFVLSLTLMFASQSSADSLQTAIEAFANKDYQQAKISFLKLAQDDDKSNDMIAQFGLAKMYRFGLGMDVNYSEALKWYQLAAQNSYGVAQSHLGEMYEYGHGVKKDIDMAKSWYQIACSNRCSEGCRSLSRLNDSR